MSNFVCICNQCVKDYDEDFDAYFCRTCNVWLEEACKDPSCDFCASRPSTPFPTPTIF